MEGTSSLRTPLSALVRVIEEGLDMDRLLFAKYLVQTGRLNEDLRPPLGSAPLALAA